MSTNISTSTLEIVAAGKSAATDIIIRSKREGIYLYYWYLLVYYIIK